MALEVWKCIYPPGGRHLNQTGYKTFHVTRDVWKKQTLQSNKIVRSLLIRFLFQNAGSWRSAVVSAESRTRSSKLSFSQDVIRQPSRIQTPSRCLRMAHVITPFPTLRAHWSHALVFSWYATINYSMPTNEKQVTMTDQQLWSWPVFLLGSRKLVHLSAFLLSGWSLQMVKFNHLLLTLKVF